MSALPAIDPKDAVWIQRELYCKSPEGLEAAATQLRELGYVVKDMRQDEVYMSGALWGGRPVDPPAEPIWEANLDVTRVIKCYDCQGRILEEELRSPGYVCTRCGATTPVERDGCPPKGQKFVQVWQDVEYEYDSYGHSQMPFISSFRLEEAWHWAPLEPSPSLYHRVISASPRVSVPSYYTAGQPVFFYHDFQDMEVFIRHFTTLDADAWRNTRFRSDGPGAIADIAAFCHPESVVKSEPNIGNAFAALSGVDRSPENLRNAAQALQDDERSRGMLGIIWR